MVQARLGPCRYCGCAPGHVQSEGVCIIPDVEIRRAFRLQLTKGVKLGGNGEETAFVTVVAEGYAHAVEKFRAVCPGGVGMIQSVSTNGEVIV